MNRVVSFAASTAAWLGRALVVFAVMLATLSLDARAQLWNWARGAGGQSTSTDYYVYGYRSTVDNNGNVYVTGYFYYYATFGTTTIYAYGGSANYDMFVAKYDASGNLQWVRSGGGTSSEYGYGIDVDNNGNVYVAGYYYSNPAYFGSWSLATQTTPDVFIVKYDANGNVQWAARQAGPSTDILYNLAVNKQTGDCYIAGYFSSSTYYFSAASSSYTTLSAFGGIDGFVAKYNTNGVFQWARAIGGSSTEYTYGVGVDGNGNVYATGMTYSYPCYFGSTSYLLYYPYSTPETWLCKFDANGNYQWATWGITGSNYEWTMDLAVNNAGDIAIGGYFRGTAYGGNSQTISSGDSYYDGFVVKFNTNGVVQWARNFGTTNCYEYAQGVGIDNGGSVYLGGYTYPYSTVNWSFGSTTFSYTAYRYQCWVGVWRTNGQPLGGLSAEGTSTQVAYNIGVDPSRKEGAITGYYYSNPLTFGSGSGAPQLYNYIGYPAMFVGKFSVPLDYDLGLTAVASPVAPFAAGSQNISVTLRNFGAQTITSAQIFWSINGVTQTPINWSGSLGTNQSTAVNLGTANFSIGAITTISATVCCPNGQTDENSANNTITAQLAPGLSGTYTIGGTSPDFTDVVSAANALRLGGTLGAVTFNIRPGTYSGHVFITNPPGNQQSRPIVFQSENGNAASVIIVHNGGTTQTAALNGTGVTGGEPTVRLLNADWVTFKNVTVQATGTGGSNWAVCAELMGNSNSDGCDGVTFDGVVFSGRTSSGFYYNDILLLSNSAYHTGLVVKNCTFQNGSASLYVWRTTTPFMGGHQYVDNTFTNFYAGAIFSNVTDGLVIRRNVISSSSSGLSAGVYIANNIGNFRFEKNRLLLTGSPSVQVPGLWLQARSSSNPGAPLVANNFIRVSGAMWGIRCASTSNTKVFHNTVYSDGWSVATQGVPVRVDGSTVGMSLNNNIFYAASGQSAAMDMQATGAFASLDYNTVYTPGSVIGYWGTTGVMKGASGNELSAWRTTSGRDQNSQFAPIVFANVGAGDLSLTQVDSRLYGLGSTSNGTYNMGLRNDVPDDIFGNTRNRSEVYNGAHQIIPVISFNPPPPSEVVGCQGTTLTISGNAQVTYGAQLSYQWLRNGAPLLEGVNGYSGTQSGVLVISNTVQSLHEGDYVLYVTATGGADPLASPVIAVRVNAPIAIEQQPSSRVLCRGQETALSVIASGTVLGYQWQKDGRAISGATNPILVIPNVDEASSGRYTCVLYGTCGTEQVVTQEAVVYIAPQTLIARQPERVAVAIGGTARLEVEPVSAQIPGYSPQYQWYRGTVALRDDGRITGTTTSELTIRNVRQSDIGEDYYCVVTGLCGTETSNQAGLYVGQVTIEQAPQDVRVCSGQDAVLRVQASSNIPNAVYSYQWSKDGQALSEGGRYQGVTTSVLRIVGATATEAGQYTVEVVANPGGAVASASVTVSVDEPPVVTGEPEDVAVCEGSRAQMSVVASGGGLRYQWYASGAPIPGATGATVEQEVVAAMDGMRVWCEVRNDCGEATTRQAVVTVKRKPQIVEQPQGGQVSSGGAIELRVVAQGESLRYQWKKDGQAIPDATGSVYRIENFGSGDAGQYVVEVSNDCGTVSSSDVTVVLSSVEEEARVAGYGVLVHPQPAGERVELVLSSPAGAMVTVEIVDLSGRVVGQLWQGVVEGTSRRVEADCSQFASGVYRCVLRSGRYRVSTPLIIVR
ncbi:MAG: hypothetical protein KatS3mg040_1596 [Candidatus Kapaibacterium sp.]|nr:MAG: hypothetical protein KatS3mg040_1596 [Candidatus Kapabacteria bacterium]